MTDEQVLKMIRHSQEKGIPDGGKGICKFNGRLGELQVMGITLLYKEW